MSTYHKLSLESIADSFASMCQIERLEALVEYGGSVPDLQAKYAAIRDAGIGLVLECQSPVFIVADVQDDVLHIHADAPHEAPVARGFVGLLIRLFDDAPVELLRMAPERILDYLHLAPVLSMRRTRGLTGIYVQLRRVLDASADKSDLAVPPGNSQIHVSLAESDFSAGGVSLE